jgi:hypothetical protein
MKYRVQFEFYQYNTGMADNGYYIDSIYTADLTRARKIASKINHAFRCRHNPGRLTEMIQDEYLPNPGYFTSEAKIFEVTENLIQ